MEQERQKLIGYFNQRLHLLIMLDIEIDEMLSKLYLKSIVLFNIPNITTDKNYDDLIDVIMPLKVLNNDIYNEVIILYGDLLQMSEESEIYEISGAIHGLINKLKEMEYDF